MNKLAFLPLLIFSFVLSNAQTQSFTSTSDIFGSRVFIENKGQFDGALNSSQKVYFGLNNGNERVFFTAKGLTYVLVKNHPIKEWQREAIEHGRKPQLKENDIYYVNMNWLNPNTNATIEAAEKQEHYFTYGGPEKNANCFKKIVYKNIYNHIDIEYIIPEDRENGIKYNVIVHPGGDPRDVRFVYSGDAKDVSISSDGNIKVKTPLDPIIEHAPVSFDHLKNVVPTVFELKKNVISFNFLNGYDTTKTLIIDPWVTNLSTLNTHNYGYDVDYDNYGNLFVYGGGYPNRVAKYGPAGNLIWTFPGTVTTPAWSNIFCTSNFVVHKVQSKIYTGQGYAAGGTRVIRLDVNGNYDNFISANVSTWMECWDMAYHCPSGNIYGLGGSTISKQSVAIINQTTGAVNSLGFVQHGTFAHDIVSHAIDNNGEAYWLYASLFGSPSLNNQIVKINSAFTSSVWLVPSTYNSMTEAGNKNFYLGGASASNGFNCLDVNANFLFYYDGFNLAAYNKTNGTKVGFTTIAGNNLKQQGGIAVDDCNNVYIGGKNGDVLCYNFNGTTFSALPSVNLGVTTTNKFVYDIKMDKVNNILYVSGSGFVAQNIAANSLACINTSYQVVTDCVSSNNGFAITTVSTNITNPVFSFTYVSTTSTVATILNQASASTTINNLTNGNYTVNIQINAPCGPVKTLTFNINCLCTATPAITSSCTPNGPLFSFSVSAINGFSSTPTFSWSGPANYTSSIQSPTLINGSYGVYTLTAQEPGCVHTSTITAPAVNIFTPILTSTATSCFGYSNGMANVSAITGTSTAPYTFSWTSSPVQTTSLATSLSVGNYTCYVKDAKGCTYFGTTTVNEPPPLVVNITSNTLQICMGKSFNLSGSGATNYTWSPNIALSSSVGVNIVATPSVTQTYSVLGSQNTCTGVAAITLSVIQLPELMVQADRTVICQGQNANINANGASGYTWTPNFYISNQYSNFIQATPPSSTTYFLVGKNENCFATYSLDIIVVPNPILNLTTSNHKICYGKSTTIFATGAQTYHWLPNEDINFISIQEASVSPTVSTNYTVTGINTSGITSCVFTKEIEIEVVPQVTANVINGFEICEGASVKLSAGGSNTYIWSPVTGLSNSFLANPFAQPKQTTIYTVNVSNGGYCGATATVLVKVNPNPTVNAGSDIIFNADEPIFLNAKGDGKLMWMEGDGIYCKPCPNSQIFPNKSGCYKIQALNEFGCTAVDEVCVELTKNHNIYIPNTFTPNDDGINDVFLVYGTGINKVEITIFNKWGEKLFTSSDLLPGWDGTFRGELSKEDVYVYMVKYVSLDGKNHSVTGHITLLK